MNFTGNSRRNAWVDGRRIEYQEWDLKYRALIRNLAYAFLGRKRLQNLRWSFGTRIYSQEGEDAIIRRYFERRDRGFYVDVGAHHPFRFSNTALLYARGWRGVNIDANPGSLELFRKYRPRDINLEIGIAEKSGEQNFFIFEEPAYNTFDKDTADSYIGRGLKLASIRNVATASLADILNRWAGQVGEISLLSVDAEGFDLAVLKSNDWIRFRPEIVIVEDLGKDILQIFDGEIHKFLSSVGYGLFAKTVNSVIYKASQLDS